MTNGARRSDVRERTEPTDEPRHVAQAPAPPFAHLLALQRSAGNAAVSRMLSRSATLARLDDGKIGDRAYGIWEEQGSKTGQTMEQQGADWNEAKRQTGGMERETTRRAEANYNARGGGESTPEQAQQDWAKAEKSIVTDFRCERYEDWTKLLARGALWGGVAGGAPTSDLTAIKTKLGELQLHLRNKDDLGERLTLITGAEGLIDGWISAHGSGPGAAKADELLMLKLHSLSYERRRRLKQVKIQDTYGIKTNNLTGLMRHKQAFTKGANATSLAQIEQLTTVSLFSLEELDMLIDVFSNYGPLLGKERDTTTLGAQPLDNFTRFGVGLDEGANPNVNQPVRSPGDFGVTIGDTITMYDKSNRDTLDFPTTQQQFRGTIEHELSHALLESLPGGGTTMIQKFATDTDYWGGNVFASKYPSPTAATTANSELPPTSYGRKTAQEDLAECMMFFFEDPKDLETRCPKRFAWIKTNIGPKLGPEHMKKIKDGKF